MEISILWQILAAILVLAGLAGLFLPVLPGGRAVVCRTRGSNMSPIQGRISTERTAKIALQEKIPQGYIRGVESGPRVCLFHQLQKKRRLIHAAGNQ